MFDLLGNGRGPLPLGDAAGSGLVCYPNEIFQTPNLDLTKTTSNIELIPAKPGHVPVLIRTTWIILSSSGTQTTPSTVRAGSDAGHTNFFASSSTPSNANVNGANVPSISIGPNPLPLVQLFPGATIYMDVTSPALGTGGFSLFAKLSCQIIWAATGGAS